MPKLNTTADKIELTTNKILYNAGVPDSSWTDTEYPSARSLYRAYTYLKTLIDEQNADLSGDISDLSSDIDERFGNLEISPADVLDLVYPVGSIYVSSETTTTDLGNGYSYLDAKNPASTLGGGTWRLVDMQYKSNFNMLKSISGCWTKTKASLRDESTIEWEGNTIRLHLGFFIDKSTSVTDASNTVLGTLNFSKLGLNENETLLYPVHATCFSEVGNAVALCQIAQNGQVKLLDVIGASGATSMVTNNSSYTTSVIFDVVLYAPLYGSVGAYSKDVAKCDKFYWERTA